MKFFVNTHLPDNFDPSGESADLGPAIHAINAEMEAAGALFFACGLAPAAHSKVATARADDSVIVTDGPYLETKEHIGGFYILDASSMDEALMWAKKCAVIGRRPIEVRQIFFDEG